MNAPPRKKYVVSILGIVFSLFCSLTQAQNNVQEYCSGISSTLLTYTTSIGQDLLSSPTEMATIEARLIGNTTSGEGYYNLKECRRIVQPDQMVSVNVEGYFEPIMERIGTITLGGEDHGIYPVSGYPDLGVAASYQISDNSGYLNRHPVVWTPLNHDGIPSDPSIGMSVYSASTQATRMLPLFRLKTYLLWVGSSPPEQDITEGIIYVDLIKLNLRIQRKASGVWGWQNMSSLLGTRIFLNFLAINGTCTTPPASDMVKLPMVWANEFTGEGTCCGSIFVDS